MAPKKEPKEEQKVSALEKVRALIEQKFGKNTIVPASKMPPHIRLSTGIVSYDLGLGGGYARGGLHIVHGQFSTGKTTVCCKTIAKNQGVCRYCNTEIKLRIIAAQCKDCGSYVTITDGCTVCGSPHLTLVTEPEPDQICTCGKKAPNKAFYLDNEGTFDPLWAYECGIDLDLLEVIRPDYAEQSIDIMEALIRTGEVDIVAWDSIPASTPAKEIEDSTEDWQVGLHARLINKACRLIQSGQNSLGIMNAVKPVIIAVSQPRMKVGVMYGDPEVLPGGKGQEFTAMTMTKLWSQGKMLHTGKISDGKAKGNPVGNNVHFKTMKNKTFPPFQEGNFVVFHTDGVFPGGVPYAKAGIDNDAQLIDVGITYGLVGKSGAWFEYEDARAQGQDNFALELMARPELMEQLKELVTAEIKKKYRIS